ncbi:hypothetical protein L0668_13205 [Paraglaciecola aquimarina]|uniref:DUF1570 domain-containing protein n=1 Tax=Paraglaciecola algarum TaxID=3050085 RepID=A0ABS9DAM1_9ALTE|nr:hypothetical protein [Paraglaciecola sp. G1-23]MCF2949073.1 hypothetical protein [Paraglaciecola sp. G1-23]
MYKLFKYLLLILFLVLASFVGLFILSIESEPQFSARSGQQVDQAESVKKLMKQLSDSVKNRETQQNITITESQLNSLVGFAQRAHKPLQGQVEITSQSALILASYALPQNPLGNYINIEILMLSGVGIQFEHVKVGPFLIPGNLALRTLVTIANWYTGSDIATQFVQQVENVTMYPQKMILAVRPLDQFLKDLNEVKQGVGGSSDEELRLRTAYYLKNLSDLDIGNKTRPQSLAKFMGPLFNWAKQRSTYETAAQENKAAILALAIYAGHHRFANFVGDVQPEVGKVALPRVKPMLKYRGDLNQHFLFSAAIKILSEQGLSIAIGEFKELMDRGKGGSGYSFVDLAADIAGVEFARAATDPTTAWFVQQKLANNYSEGLFFPQIKGLPEGLRKEKFTKQFGEVDSPKYVKMLDEIQRRIANLPIHSEHQ